MKTYAYLALPILLTACPIMPGPSGESTDGADGDTTDFSGDGDGDGDSTTATGDGDGDGDGDPSTETGDGDGDAGDGDPGDGDGDGCPEPTFAADSNNMSWVTFDDWPAWAQRAELVDLQSAIDLGVLVPVELGLAGGCYEIEGFGVHTCILEVNCIKMIGYPILEAPLTEKDCAPIGGAWNTVGLAPTIGGGCWGSVSDFVVRLSVDAPVCDGPPGDVGCECPVDGCLDGLTCKSGFCSPCTPGLLGCECGDGNSCNDGLACVNDICD